MGDFNQIIHPNEKLGGKPPLNNKLQAFQDFMSINGLLDLKSTGLKFTWCNLRTHQLILAKLDRSLANLEFINLFPNALLTNAHLFNSDHNPIIFSSNDHNSFKRPYLFKIELLWFSIDFFFPKVLNSQSSSCTPFLSKLESLSCTLRDWRGTISTSFKRDIRIMRGRLLGIQKAMEANPMNHYLWDLYEKVHYDLIMVLNQEEQFWKIKARRDQVTQGERNTFFFHKSVIIHRKSNKIESLI